MTTDTEIDDGLTEEERAALNDDDGAGTGTDTGTDPDAEKAAEAAAAAEADKAKQDAEAAAAKAKEEEAAAAAAAATEKPADGTTTETTTEAPQAQQPILVANPVEDAEARLTEIATKKDALLTQFDDGDITAKEYQKQLDELSKQERRIEFEVHEAQLASKLEQQRLQNEWTATCNTFVESHPVYKDNPRLYKALDAEVRELAGKPETANWSGQKFLDEAHKNLVQAFGLKEAGSTPPAAKHNPAANLPPNLAKVPAAEVEDTNGGKFAVLDRLASSDPIAYEETLAKMSEAERTAYLNA